jgi:hypothetical protein
LAEPRWQDRQKAFASRWDDAVSFLKQGNLHREDAKSAKGVEEPAHNPLSMRLIPSLRRFQQAGPQGTVHPEHGVHHVRGDLLDFLPRSFHRLFPSRSSHLRGGNGIPADARLRRRPRRLLRVRDPFGKLVVKAKGSARIDGAAILAAAEGD